MPTESLGQETQLGKSDSHSRIAFWIIFSDIMTPMGSKLGEQRDASKLLVWRQYKGRYDFTLVCGGIYTANVERGFMFRVNHAGSCLAIGRARIIVSEHLTVGIASS